MFRGGSSAGVVRGDVQLEACSNIEIFIGTLCEVQHYQHEYRQMDVIANIEIFIDTLCDTQWTSQQILGFAFMSCMIFNGPHSK